MSTFTQYAQVWCNLKSWLLEFDFLIQIRYFHHRTKLIFYCFPNHLQWIDRNRPDEYFIRFVSFYQSRVNMQPLWYILQDHQNRTLKFQNCWSLLGTKDHLQFYGRPKDHQNLLDNYPCLKKDEIKKHYNHLNIYFIYNITYAHACFIVLPEDISTTNTH